MRKRKKKALNLYLYEEDIELLGQISGGYSKSQVVASMIKEKADEMKVMEDELIKMVKNGFGNMILYEIEHDWIILSDDAKSRIKLEHEKTNLKQRQKFAQEGLSQDEIDEMMYEGDRYGLDENGYPYLGIDDLFEHDNQKLFDIYRRNEKLRHSNNRDY